MHRIGMLEADVLHRKRRLHPLRDAHERFIALEADNPAAGMKERDTEGFAPIAGAHPQHTLAFLESQQVRDREH